MRTVPRAEASFRLRKGRHVTHIVRPPRTDIAVEWSDTLCGTTVSGEWADRQTVTCGKCEKGVWIAHDRAAVASDRASRLTRESNQLFDVLNYGWSA